MNDILKTFVKQALKEGISSEKSLSNFKNKFCEKYKISAPKNMGLIKAYKSLIKKREIKSDEAFFRIIRKGKVRSLSGIASITVITKEYPCPGKCVFCPTEKGMPKSYLSNEPAIMRAILNKFDAFNQTRTRLDSLDKAGHSISKIDVIIAGGTFSFYPKSYRTKFVKAVYDALNYPKKSKNLEEAQLINEKSNNRCIGLSIETRPDYVNTDEVKYLRKLGVTKVELGIQTLYDDVLKKNLRGHGVKASIDAIRMLKDAGFKINCHMMPGLMGSDLRRDLKMFKELFDNADFRPDWLKIYPCVVVPGSVLANIWKNGGYKPYTDKQMIDLLVKVKSNLPKYVRITRLYRDIPSTSILAGPKLSNLREYAQKEMARKGLKCRCVRCREIKDEVINPENLEMKVLEFNASKGKEFFLSFDDVKKDKLCSLLRLRFPSSKVKFDKNYLPELNGSTIIREVHTYGIQTPVDKKGSGAQHLGLGRKLIEKAEEIAKNAGYKKIAVISGVGVRDYYKKFGYSLSKAGYMIKAL
ncbi:MAG: histone acetyltransferase, ELP3 family, elongator complex protein 3 [Candidatus Peregrinibacteria bacterium GW2011_GWF2_38_29]|nr:MAG: histone acetyltransferase, ELP3 family, elongator complex protein 3 [Candidatus Peregrinibacteria bacterium GW2011_GWF2_38_29]HBB02989.1 tRNA uridine(34) 5-carboxymethylaminomethyl modification radical SAM/GNAT enzyme Elp3 [Candidatus Peregrinibacteria bacterium]